MPVELEQRRAETDRPALEVIRESWRRSSEAGVRADLPAAPMVLDEQGLVLRREHSEWLAEARQVLAPYLDLVEGSGHVLTLFDRDGNMLASDGDPRVLERLNDIHFIPGANWAETAAGTNGPGTALATGRAAHVVGPEHFCSAWHPWHCAAVPLRSPRGELVGALDVSGPVARADERVLGLARSLGAAVEQALKARAYRRQVQVLARFAELCARFPRDTLLALDDEGVVLQATGPGVARGVPTRLRIPRGVAGLSSAPTGAPWLEGAAVHAVSDDRTRVGLCLVVPEARRVSRKEPGGRGARPVRFTFADLVGEGLREAVELARTAAATALPVLLTGETGVGKELFAQAIHAASDRAQGPFVAVNCGALPPGLVESELFGHAGGAFTGARAAGATGKFEAAHQGTLFLDEVGELPLPAQAALLRVLQERCVTPVGSTECRPVDVRVVAATNRPLDQAIQSGTFRLDLFHRLDVVGVKVPPLRERLADLPSLVERLQASVELELGLPVRLSEEVLEAFGRHAWPGNVRELENVLRRLAVVGQQRVPGVADLPFTAAPPPQSAPDAQRLLEAIHGTRSMSEAAAKLGMNRSTLYRQLDRLGLRPGRTVTPLG